MKKLIYIIALIATNMATFYYVSRHDVSEDYVIEETLSKEVISIEVIPERVHETIPTTPQYDEAGLEDVGQALLSMEDSSLKDALLDVFTSGWFSQDHIALAEWLNEQAPDLNTDQALAAFANLASEIDPEGAVEWAASVMTPSLREQALQRTASEFRRFDPVGFKDFMVNNGATARAIRNAGVISSGVDEEVAQRFDIIEDSPEPLSRILARRTRLAGSSSRVNNVLLTLD